MVEARAILELIIAKMHAMFQIRKHIVYQLRNKKMQAIIESANAKIQAIVNFGNANHFDLRNAEMQATFH